MADGGYSVKRILATLKKTIDARLHVPFQVGLRKEMADRASSARYEVFATADGVTNDASFLV